MKSTTKKKTLTAVCLLLSFILWTLLVRTVDVRAIGPDCSSVGFATINRFVQELTGVHWWLYTVTDWLGLVPFATAFGFAVLGLWQWITRKSLLRVDRSLLLLGVLYAIVIALYLLFETVVVNYRPVLVDGVLEASYPSSTTLLTVCVMPTASMQLDRRFKSGDLRRMTRITLNVFTLFMVVARLLSGVHWLTDIVGGILLGAGLVTGYRTLTDAQ